MVEMSDWGKYARWKRGLVIPQVTNNLPDSFFDIYDIVVLVELEVYGLLEEVSEW